MAQLNKVENNNGASEVQIKKHAGNLRVLTGVITKLTMAATALETRFQSVEENVWNVVVQLQGFSQNMATIQKQLATMAPGTFPISENPVYPAIPPRLAPFSQMPEIPQVTPISWDYDMQQREEQWTIGNTTRA